MEIKGKKRRRKKSSQLNSPINTGIKRKQSSMQRYKIATSLGEKTQRLLNADINKMTKEELQQGIKSLSFKANLIRSATSKLYKEKNLPTPTVYKEWYNESRKQLEKLDDKPTSIFEVKFSINEAKLKTMERGELMHQFRIIRDFLQARTNTVEKWESQLNKFIERVSSKTGINKDFLNKNYYDSFWEIYNKTFDYAINNFTDSLEYSASQQLQEYIAQKMEDYGNLSDKDKVDKIIDDLINNNENYLRELEKRSDNTDDSEAGFRLSENKENSEDTEPGFRI